MPGFDRSGPMGAGPMTGGGRGFCNPVSTGYETRFFGNYGFGRGMGPGRGFRGGYGPGMRCGFGRGFARMSLPPYDAAYFVDSADEVSVLKAQADSMKNALNMINRRIADFEKNAVKPSDPGEADD